MKGFTLAREISVADLGHGTNPQQVRQNLLRIGARVDPMNEAAKGESLASRTQRLGLPVRSHKFSQPVPSGEYLSGHIDVTRKVFVGGRVLAEFGRQPLHTV